MRPDRVIKGVELIFGGQRAVQQQVTDFDEVRVLGKLLDRVAPVHQDAFFPVDERDVGLAAARRDESGVVGEHALFAVQACNVDNIWSCRTGQDR